jgi:predicted MFS family arabinose efflux permease
VPGGDRLSFPLDTCPFTPSRRAGGRTTRRAMQLPLLALLLYALMLPVTGMVPVLEGLTVGRYPELSEFHRHLFMSANMFGALLCVPLVGLLSDALRRRRVLILVALALNTLTLYALTQEWSYGVYLTWRFLEGCAHISALTLLMTLGADNARAEGLGGAMGLVGAAVSLGVASGAPLGGWVGGEDALQVPRLGAWLMLALTVMAAALLRDPPHLERREESHNPLGSLIRNHRLLVPYVFAFADRLTVGFIVSTMSLYLSGVLGLSPTRIGILMATFLIPFSLLTYPAGLLSKRWNAFTMMFSGSFLYGIVLMLLGFSPPGGIAWLMAAGGVVAALMYAPSLVLTARLAGSAHKAGAMSGFHFAGSLGFALGPLLGGALVSFFATVAANPYPGAFVVVGSIEIFCVLALIPVLRRQEGRT